MIWQICGGFEQYMILEEFRFYVNMLIQGPFYVYASVDYSDMIKYDIE
mgnify:FL=1